MKVSVYNMIIPVSIKGLDHYLVSKEGCVYSRRGKELKSFIKDNVKKVYVYRKGNNGKIYPCKYSVAKLVWTAFNPADVDKKGLRVKFKDNNYMNTSFYNLYTDEDSNKQVGEKKNRLKGLFKGLFKKIFRR